MPDISIRGTTIDFPDAAEPASWAQAMILFAQAVEDALAAVVSDYDIAPQIYTMVADVNSGVSITGLSFSTTVIRSAVITYYVFRDATTDVVETGTLTVVYNAANGVGDKWEMTREYDGNASVTFAISDAGQVTFSSTTLSGWTAGKIGFTARTLEQS